MAGPNLTPRPSIPGGYNAASETASNFKFIYLVKQEAFTINVSGLMPHTLHHVFFEGKRVDDKIKPLNGKLGDYVFTDRDGKAEFVFYYQSDVVAATTEEQYNELSQRVGGSKTVVVANAVDTLLDLPDQYDSVFSSYCVKQIGFKTQSVEELPVKSNYSFAYPYIPPPPPPPPVVGGRGEHPDD